VEPTFSSRGDTRRSETGISAFQREPRIAAAIEEPQVHTNSFWNFSKWGICVVEADPTIL
jgi:hypothetical protein